MVGSQRSAWEDHRSSSPGIRGDSSGGEEAKQTEIEYTEWEGICVRELTNGRDIVKQTSSDQTNLENI